MKFSKGRDVPGPTVSAGVRLGQSGPRQFFHMSTLEIINASTKHHLGSATFNWIPDAQFDILRIRGKNYAVVGHLAKTILVRCLSSDAPKQVRVRWLVPAKEGKSAVPQFRSHGQPNEFVAPPPASVRRNRPWRPRKWPENIEAEVGE